MKKNRELRSLFFTIWSAPDSTGGEPASKRVKLSAEDQDIKENYHRDDPQIGVCLECLR